MKDFLNDLRNKSIHIVGVTGAEGSSILRFLVKHKIGNITVHDFLKAETVEKSFRLWHKGLTTYDREKLFSQFKSDLSLTKQNFNSDYLTSLESADIIFVPQSWRLYKKENQKLRELSDKIPFYSLTRLYLDFAPAKIVAVTGTVGKGSTANIIFQLLKATLPVARNVYFAGNDTWMIQLADKLDEMGADDILILEISHRQLQDGFNRAPWLVVVTNLYPNHLDEVHWDEYRKLKLSLLERQERRGISILNYDTQELRVKNKLNSRVFYFSEKYQEMNTKNIQKIYPEIMSMKGDHYLSNIFAGLTVGDILGIESQQLSTVLPKLRSLPGRLELVKTAGGINIFNDIKSTTPWATLAAVKKLGDGTILICGGRTKKIEYKDFANEIKDNVKFIVAVKSEMSAELVKLLPKEKIKEVIDFKSALNQALQKAVQKDNILISPAAGFFYSDFIRGKESIRKLVISLLPKERV